MMPDVMDLGGNGTQTVYYNQLATLMWANGECGVCVAGCVAVWSCGWPSYAVLWTNGAAVLSPTQLAADTLRRPTPSPHFPPNFPAGDEGIKQLFSRGTHKRFSYTTLAVMGVTYLLGAALCAGSAISSGLFVSVEVEEYVGMAREAGAWGKGEWSSLISCPRWRCTQAVPSAAACLRVLNGVGSVMKGRSGEVEGEGGAGGDVDDCRHHTAPLLTDDSLMCLSHAPCLMLFLCNQPSVPVLLMCPAGADDDWRHHTPASLMR